jgi:hypothetical protein
LNELFNYDGLDLSESMQTNSVFVSQGSIHKRKESIDFRSRDEINGQLELFGQIFDARLPVARRFAVVIVDF